MKKKKVALGKKATTTMAVLFAAAVLGIGGIAINSIDNTTDEELLDLNEEKENTEIAKNDVNENSNSSDNLIQEYDSEFGMDNVMDATDEYIEEAKNPNSENDISSDENTEVADSSAEPEDTTEVAANDGENNETSGNSDGESSGNNEEPELAQASSSAISSNLDFNEESTLLWPVDGNVLLNYNMDSTVYFATLEQYKYNPAIIIQGDVGSLVSAAAKGVVEEIYEDSETGTTVVMNLGNNYKATYGQLQNLQINIGSAVEKGDIIGEVSEPTKYYSVEGSNLYFKLEKDSESKDPLNYLE